MTENCEVEVEQEKANVAVEGDSTPDNVEELEKKSSTEEVKEEEDEDTQEEDFKEKYYYLAAEFDNALKRFEREREKFVKFGNEKILKALLDVMDNLDRTIQSIAAEEDDKIKNIHKGIEMVQAQFLKVLTDNGLEKIESLGQKFDPNHHEAMAQQPAEGKEDDEIVQVYQDGYKLNGRLLRAAKVIIVKNN